MIARLLDWWRKLGDGPMEEDDPEWQTVLNKVEVACKGITLRQLVRPPALKLNKSLGSLRRVCIARDPIEIDELMAPKRRPTCALCGKTTEEGPERIPASVQPEFENGMSYIECVWVHLMCYEECTETREPRGAPA
jgi:hypothetical protein